MNTVDEDSGVPQHSYDSAVNTLNAWSSINSKLSPHPGHFQLEKMIVLLNRCGVSDEDLDRLSVIHVAGTKGKGSTCVFCEQLLLRRGYRTGLFTSPHLIAVQERFRVDGKIISEDKFVHYFWSVYNSITSNRSSDEELPSFFMFLSIMAFKMFVDDEVNVAIFETGLGGEYDSTNVLRKTSVVGISSLGFDHMTILGNSLREIAWQKSGIMKPNSVTIISNDQPSETLDVLIERSVEKQTTLLEAPPFDMYNWHTATSKIGVLSSVQKINVSLAIQLTNAWINRNNTKEWLEKCDIGLNGIKQAPIWEITKEDILALTDVEWLGRNQVLKVSSNLTYFLDGAHTIESIQLCRTWFLDLCPKSQTSIKNYLIFNVTDRRDYRSFLKVLTAENKIDLVLLCPIITFANNPRSDSIAVDFDEQLTECHNMKNSIDFCNIEVLKSIEEIIERVELGSCSEKNTQFRVLITGSLKLVGGALKVLKT